MFATSSFETRFTPRGIYFTSGTQEGLPFDRVMGELNRYLQLPTANSGAQANAAGQRGRGSADPGGQRPKLLPERDAGIGGLPESGLAGSNRWWEYRNRALHWAGYIALAVIPAVLAMLWFTSYGNNKAYLAEVAAKVPGVERRAKPDAVG